jgi:ABC-2 type transport system permease protein
MVALIRREFWEHRLLVIAPLVLCVLYILLCAFGGARLNLMPLGSEVPPSAGFLIVMHTVFTVLLYLLMAVVAFFYLCDCLYSERKDRSILFWKSLPVSDTMTVLSKLIVALICIPVVVYVLSFVTNLIAFALFNFLFHPAAPPGDVVADWSIGGWLRLNGYLIADIPVLALWFAPVAAYQLIISAVAPRAPFVITVLPPLTLMIGEALFFRTRHVAEFVGHRLVGRGMLTPPSGHGVQSFIDSVNALPLLSTPELWLGVAFAAVVIFVTIRIRRRQQDS